MGEANLSQGDHSRWRKSRWRSSRLSADLDGLNDLAAKALFHLLVHNFL